MNVTLYTTADDMRTVNKTLTSVKSVTATPTEPMNILAPTLIIDYDSTVLSANYMYIAALNRYYYIDNMDLLKGNRLLISCRVDVLKTYAAALTDCECIVTRSESIGAPTEIPDKNLPVDPNKEDIYSIVFDKDPFNIDLNSNAKCWQLTTNGGEPIGN